MTAEPDPPAFGYLVPEFPGQTHVFFWRELRELERLGARPHLFSTRRPLARLLVHEWTREAMDRTTYLHPLGLGIVRDVFSVSPLGVARAAWLALTASDATVRERLQLLAALPFAIELAAELRRRGLRHIHAHFTYRGADVALLASIVAGVGFSLSRHGPDHGVGNRRNKWRLARFGTVVSRAMLRELETELAGFLPERVFVHSMGVDTDRFRRAVPYEPPRPGERVRIFSCGRIDRGKGHDVAIRMVAELRGRGVAAELRIAGSTSPGAERYHAELEEAVRALALEESVRFLGGLPEDGVVAELERAHAFVLASRDEPLGVAYMEAMAMEVPTLATRGGGVPELIEDRRTGLLVPVESPGALADAVCWLVANPAAIAPLTAAARRFIVENHQARRGAERLARAVAESLARAVAESLARGD